MLIMTAFASLCIVKGLWSAGDSGRVRLRGSGLILISRLKRSYFVGYFVSSTSLYFAKSRSFFYLMNSPLIES